MENTKKQNSQFMRVKAAADHIGISLATIYRLEETDPDFPKKVRFTSRCCGFLRDDLDAYLIKKRDQN